MHNVKSAGYEYGYVDYIDVPRFDGGTARYVLTYYPLVPLTDPFGAALVANDDNAADRTVPLLKSIDFPEGYRMSFTYDASGMMTSRTLPTGGQIEYELESYAFQHQMCTVVSSPTCSGSNPYPGMPMIIPNDQCGGLVFSVNCNTSELPGTFGVGTKTLVPDPSTPAVAYTWNYTRTPFTKGPFGMGGQLTASNPWKVVTTDPYGNDMVNYYHATLYPRDPNIPSHDDNEPWWKNGLVRKTEYYRGSSDSLSNLVKTVENDWEDHDYSPNPPYHRAEYKRIKESRVIYNDAAGVMSRTVNEDWDGHGNFRKVTEFGFNGLPYRIHKTDYNCDVIDPSGTCSLSAAHASNWILGTYSYDETLDPDGVVLRRSEFQFDDRGYLRTQKDLLTIPPTPGLATLPGTPNSGSPGDIYTEYCYDGEAGCAGETGNPAQRSGMLRSKTVTNFGFDPTFSYQEISTYDHGPHLKSRQIQNIPWNTPVQDRFLISSGCVIMSPDEGH